MLRLPLKYTAWLLVAAVLLMLGSATGAAFAHEIQHAAHHSAGMHSSGICAWMCATAGTLYTAALQPIQYEVVLAAAVLSEPRFISRDADSSTQPRAPPTF
jgi:hypothetical protein